jgi:hypothetical protein
MPEWLIDAWNRVNVLSTESGWDGDQEVDTESNDEQKKIPTDKLAGDELLSSVKYRKSLEHSEFHLHGVPA